MGPSPHLLPYAALAAVCFFWGTTYVGIRMALESFPPLTLIAARFLLSGSILLFWARGRGMQLPEKKEILRTCAFGFMLLGVANGCLTFAETWIPSSLAALLLTTAPFWLVGLEAAIPGGEKLVPAVAVGLTVGLGGVLLLLWPGAGKIQLGPEIWKGFIVLQVGSLFWNAGSILQRRWRASSPPLLTGAMHQFSAGLVFLILALIIPQHPVHWSAKGVAGLVWLIVFGSIVGYNAYIYTLATLPISIVSIYTYINPVVAVILGRIFYDEPFGRKELLAMAVIFAGVFLVKMRSGFGRPTPAVESSPPEPRPRSSTA